MASRAPAHHIIYPLEDYLSLEASSNVKHEFLAGEIFAMAGGTPQHAALAAASIGLLFPQLRKGTCRAFDSDLRIRVDATSLVTYPDVTVVCGPREHDHHDPQALINPTLIIEVLSRSTEEYDRGDKFEHYKRLGSLRQYVLVSHQQRRVEVWTRTGVEWASREFGEGEAAELGSIGASLDVRELYESAAEPTV